jgi:hypothetical protein
MLEPNPEKLAKKIEEAEPQFARGFRQWDLAPIITTSGKPLPTQPRSCVLKKDKA